MTAVTWVYIPHYAWWYDVESWNSLLMFQCMLVVLSLTLDTCHQLLVSCSVRSFLLHFSINVQRLLNQYSRNAFLASFFFEFPKTVELQCITNWYGLASSWSIIAVLGETWGKPPWVPERGAICVIRLLLAFEIPFIPGFSVRHWYPVYSAIYFTS